MIVDIFIPCFVDQLYPQTGFSLVKVLEKAGVQVHYNTNQTCCGQPAFNSGYWNEAKEVASKFITDFPYERPLVTPSASCAGFVRKQFPELFGEDYNLYNCDKVRRNVVELTDFLVNKLHITKLGSTFKAKVCYHDSCASLREYGLKDEARKLLKNVEGLELVEMVQRETCCGFGGTFSVKFEAISTAMAEQKVEDAIATGADYITSTDASCLINLEAYIRKHQLPIKTIHIADILASGLK